MGGYMAREGPSEGVHDEVWARAAVFEANGVKAGIVVADILCAPRVLVEKVRREAAPALGVPEHHVIVAATHTHSGPAVPPFMPQADQTYISWLAGAMAECLVKADRGLSPARLGWGTAPADGVAANRRDPDLPADPTVRDLMAWGEDGSIRGVIVNFACHPTVLGWSNRMISADFPGEAMEVLGKTLGDGVWTIYAQGAAGDVSCRFTRRGQTFDEVRRLGSLVADAGRTAASQAEPVGAEPLRVGARSVSLPSRAFPRREETEAQLEKARARVKDQTRSGADPGVLRLAESMVEGYTAELMLADRLDDLETEAEIAAIGLGDVAIVAAPGELFTSVGRAILERSPFRETMVVGYAGGHVGYVPDREAYEARGYESLVSWLEPEAAHLLVDAAAGVLMDLKEKGN
jgi:hypothetical protein